MKIEQLVRKNILTLKPYRSARDEYTGKGNIWLDANESPFGKKINRYPDPQQRKLKKAIAKLKNVAVENIFLGNGSDEAIDLLYRIFCEPYHDKVLIFSPTYGMYRVAANINAVEIMSLPLSENFQINMKEALTVIKNPELKMIFICSPNNPTGNRIHKKEIFELALQFHGLIIVDEAYIDYSSKPSLLNKLTEYPNLVILQTFSKAWGMAGVRLGMAFADSKIIHYLGKVKAPYNVNELTQQSVLKSIKNVEKKQQQVGEVLSQRSFLTKELQKLAFVTKIYPTDANFMLVEFKNAAKIYKQLIQSGIIIRDRSAVVKNCLRFTVGTKKENKRLMNELEKLQTSNQ